MKKGAGHVVQEDDADAQRQERENRKQKGNGEYNPSKERSNE
jgi:hypothetical protein